MVIITPQSGKNFLIGYGSFITNKSFIESHTIFLCKIKGYRRLWFKTTVFPFILPDPSFSGIHALCFTIEEEQIKNLDKYEGVDAGLYSREKILVEFIDGNQCYAYIYIPTNKCIQEYDLTFNNDPDDVWMDEIKKFPEVCKKYPELLHHL